RRSIQLSALKPRSLLARLRGLKSAPKSLGQLVHVDGLELKIGLKPLDAVFAPDARLLEAAEGVFAIYLELVLGDGSGADLTHDVIGALRVGREHRPVQAIERIVGDADGVGFVVVGNDAHNRTKDF